MVRKHICAHAVLAERALYVAAWGDRQMNAPHAVVGFVGEARVASRHPFAGRDGHHSDSLLRCLSPDLFSGPGPGTLLPHVLSIKLLEPFDLLERRGDHS
jgi:hypothetical protein